uniref:Uncharacterized protein n=1 Tax=Rhizophora mucronata TaxID=61149 RepID=A0A2P2LXJ3_RHIMU
MDCHFSRHFMEARIPFISFLSSGQLWVDIYGESRALTEAGLEAWRMRDDSLMEAKEFVREGKNSYRVSLEGVNQNEMVLSYMGTVLVKVYSWR